MKYYIEISSWNLLESFVTESISPFSFYQERNFGNNLSRYMSGGKERTYHLILSTKDLGGDYSICVDETLIDTSILVPIKGLKTAFMYPKTIYYRKGYVSFRFGSSDLKDALISESQILLEVKSVEKYSSDFYIKTIDTKEVKAISNLGNLLSSDYKKYIDFDNSFNKIKGAITGYVRGLYTSTDESNRMLQSKLRDLKNSFGGFNTQIMINDTFHENPEICSLIDECKSMYFAQIEHTNSFDVLSAQYKEIVKLATLRAKDIQVQTSFAAREKLIQDKTSVDNQIAKIERKFDIYNVRLELENIKSLEKANGKKIGKTRNYFKKGSLEYERKKQLKQIIEDFEKNNSEYGELRGRLYQIEQHLSGDTNKYDTTISAYFARVSDIINDLIKSVASVASKDEISLSSVKISDGNILFNNLDGNPEICYFNIVLELILQKSGSMQLSEFAALQVLEESGKKFKTNPISNTDKGNRILKCLREFWMYKHQQIEQFDVPKEDMPIFQSVFAFFIKPLDYEQIERYMLLKKFSQKAYAFMLWAAWVGFADLPKTFTNILYSDEKVTSIVDVFLLTLQKQNQ